MRIFATHSITATSMWKLKFFWRQNQIFPSTCAVRSHHVLKIWMQVEKENMAQSFINLLEVSFVCCVSWTVLLTNSSLKHNFPAEGQLWTTMEAVSYLGKITSIANLGRQVIKWLLWFMLTWPKRLEMICTFALCTDVWRREQWSKRF